MPTLAEMENKVRAHSEANRLCLSRSDIRRTAKHIARRQQDVCDIDANLRILGIVSDPTPVQAFRDLTDNDRAAARRLGLAS